MASVPVDEVLRDLADPAPAAIEIPRVEPPRIAPRAVPMDALRGSRDPAGDVLAHLVRLPGVRGAVLASRDGAPVREAWGAPLDLETFCAMHATALSAAELALDRPSRAAMGLMVDLGDERILSRVVSRDHFFVVRVASGCDWESAFLWMEAAGLDLASP